MASLASLSAALCQSQVERQLGCSLSAEQSAELSRLVLERSRKLRVDASTYANGVSIGEREDEVRALAGHFTVGESYFFRDWAQLSLCCDAITKRLREHPPQRPIKILSAGCSTGEEPYSLLMMLHLQLGGTEWLEVDALDINRSALDRAKKARYSTWSLRETPDHLRDRWFHRDGRDYQLTSEIAGRVNFTCASLNVPSPKLAPQTYDFILCRNVLMYFTTEKYHEAAMRLIEALLPSGYLLLGHAESLRGMGLPVDLVQIADSFCYRKSASGTVGSPEPIALTPFAVRVPNGRPANDDGNLQTFDRPRREDPPRALVAGDSPLNIELAALTTVTPLLESERFGEALQALESCALTNSPVQRLCHSLLLIYTNRFDAATALATTLLNIEAVAAEAHYTLALCHEHSGDWADATDLAQRATYLDPTFAMPWLHLGMLSKKRGDNLAARRELLQARALLAVEQRERLLWFGGGCSRSTLLAACQRELASAGGGS